ncbi:MAG: hypothetical protein ACM3SS_22310, partial [Rhodospirillaceae bacterium]
HGQVLPPQFSDEAIKEARVLDVARRMELVADPNLDQLYPAHFAGWVAARDAGDWQRVDILDPSGSAASPIDGAGIAEKFRGINPELPVDQIAHVALDMEHHSVSELMTLVAPQTDARRRTA